MATEVLLWPLIGEVLAAFEEQKKPLPFTDKWRAVAHATVIPSSVYEEMADELTLHLQVIKIYTLEPVLRGKALMLIGMLSFTAALAREKGL